jgi:hypothetical protein
MHLATLLLAEAVNAPSDAQIWANAIENISVIAFSALSLWFLFRR